MDFLRRPGTDFDAGQLLHDVTAPLLTFRDHAIDAYAVPTRNALEWIRDDARAALEGVGREAAEYWNHYGQVDSISSLPVGSLPSLFHLREPGAMENSIS